MPQPERKENSSAGTALSAAAGNGLGLADFEYDLPAELIAQEPLAARDESRLMVVDRQSHKISNQRFSDLSQLLSRGDLIVVNDTRVIPTKLFARRAGGGSVQLLLLRPEAKEPGLWQALAAPLRKLRKGELLFVGDGDGAECTVCVHDIVTAPDGQKRLIVDLGPQERVYELLSRQGYAPLPPYIHRGKDPHKRQEDLKRYQTIFASQPGAVAAPTAGLHFSQDTLFELQRKGIRIVTITLHVGPGTFKPITSSLAEHTIESEPYTVPETTASMVNEALLEGRRVIAVGTTSCRALEAAGQEGRLKAVSGESTSLYIRPGYSFKIVKGLLTNFHLSRSSLIVLVSTFGGHDLIMRAYREAVAERYRFFSYGDAMLVL